MTTPSANNILYITASISLKERNMDSARHGFSSLIQTRSNDPYSIFQNGKRVAGNGIADNIERVIEGVDYKTGNKYIQYIINTSKGMVTYILEFQKNSKMIKINYGSLNTNISSSDIADQVTFTVEGVLNTAKGNRNLIIQTKSGSKSLNSLINENLGKRQVEMDAEKERKEYERKCMIPFVNWDKCKIFPVLEYF